MSENLLIAIVSAPTAIGVLYLVLLIIKTLKMKNGNGNGHVYEKDMLIELQKIRVGLSVLPETLGRIEGRQHRILADTGSLNGKLDIAMERQQHMQRSIDGLTP